MKPLNNPHYKRLVEIAAERSLPDISPPETRIYRPSYRVFTLLCAVAIWATAGLNSEAQGAKKRIVFYGSTFRSGGVAEQFLVSHANEYEVVARDANGNLVYDASKSQVWTPGVGGALDWNTKNIDDFASFDLLVFEDGDSGVIVNPAPWYAAILSQTQWANAVNNAAASGKRVIVWAGDPEADYFDFGTPQWKDLVEKCIEAGAARTGPGGVASGPGLVVFTAHVPATAPSPLDPKKQAIAHLLAPFGGFVAVDGADSCYGGITVAEACSHPVNDCFDPWTYVATSFAPACTLGFKSWPMNFVAITVRSASPEIQAPPALLPHDLRGVATLLARGAWAQLAADPTYITRVLGQALTITAYYKQMPTGEGLANKTLQLHFASGPHAGQADLTATTGAGGVATFSVSTAIMVGDDQIVITDITEGNPPPACSPKLGIRCFWLPAAVTVATVPGRAATAEGSQTPAVFRLTRTGDTASQLSVNLQFTGTATLGLDYDVNAYLGVGGSLRTAVIPSGLASVDVEAQALDDTRREGTETVICTVMPETVYPCQAPSQYAAGTPAQATAYVLDDPADNWQIPFAWYLYDLGTLGGDQSWALGVSQAYFDTDPSVETGTIVGGSRWQPGNNNPRAFTYTGSVQGNVLAGAMMALPASGVVWSEAKGTEMFGDCVVGRYSPDGVQIRPFLKGWWSGDLIALPVAAGAGEAVAIGWPALYPVGSNLKANGDWRATAWNPNNGYAAMDLGTLYYDTPGFNSYAYGVNNNGRVVGKSQDWSGTWHAFRTELSPYGDFAPQTIRPYFDDLGTLPGAANSEGHGISDLDEVVGQSGGYAVLWSARDSAPLQRLYASSGSGYCAAQAVSNLGVAVGCRTSSPDGAPDAAVLWWNHNAPTAVDLNSLNKTVPGGGTWDLRLASTINDNHWIVGWGYKDGLPHAFLLKPKQVAEY